MKALVPWATDADIDGVLWFRNKYETAVLTDRAERPAPCDGDMTRAEHQRQYLKRQRDGVRVFGVPAGRG